MIRWIAKDKEKSQITNAILNELPDWFGIESAIKDYVEQVKQYPMIVWEDNEVLGFVSIRETSAYAIDIYVMGILEKAHRKGIGRKLIAEVKTYGIQQGYRYLTVKTLDPLRESEAYKRTRLFYESVGFVKLETFPTLWDKSNPCLLLIMNIK